ncbi:hypothetical protein M0R04_11355 [Candidatus Dojkabacteria bacterium]|jgi:hypothetical protein|nr:hypothetical protein [Candidatus Dojkabacteria bacterium]
MKTKTPDEQIKEFEQENRDLSNKLLSKGIEIKPKKKFRWFQIPVYFALIVGLTSLMALPFLVVLALLKYLGVI